MRAAQNKFRDDYQEIEKIRGSFESVRITRQQAVEKAMTDFRATVEKARVDLKAVF